MYALVFFYFSSRELDCNVLRDAHLGSNKANAKKKKKRVFASMGIFNDLPVPSDKTVSPHFRFFFFFWSTCMCVCVCA